MKALAPSVLLLFGCSVTLIAKIGETEAQIEKALGKPFDTPARNLKSYLFGPFNVSVFFIDGVSESETFVKRDHSPISQSEIMQLIQLDGGGVVWAREKSNRDIRNWQSADRKKTRVAAYRIPSKTFVISSGKYFASHHIELDPAPTASPPQTETDDDESSSVMIGSNEYVVQKFPTPGGNLSIDTYVDFEHDDAFIRLVRLNDKHDDVISSIPFRGQKARGLRIEWNQDGKFAALSFKSGEAGGGSMRLFRVSPTGGLSELKLPSGLQVDALLPKNDPARKAPLSFATVEPAQWLNTTDLLCNVSGSARLFETPVTKPGYLWISYEVTLRCTSDFKVSVVKSKQTLYKNGDDEDGIARLGADDLQLAHYFETGAAAGDPDAQVNLGWMYHEGKGVPRDYKEAVELYEKAAEQGYAPGQAYLASAYAEGKGVDKDYQKALELFRKAIAQNDPHAFNDFAWFLATCSDDSQRNGKQAVEYARQACDLTSWKEKNFIGTLAAAYAESGDYDRAITYQLDALNRPGDYPDQQVLMNALQLYRDHKPYRPSE